MPLSTLVYGHREPQSSPTHPGHVYHSALRVCKTWPLILTGILWEGQETALSISWSSVISATFPYLDTACLLFSFPPALPRLFWWLNWQRICLQCGRPEFDAWVGKTPWKRAQQPTPVFLPGESPWTEEPGRLQPMGLQRVGHDGVTKHTALPTHLDQSSPEK